MTPSPARTSHGVLRTRRGPADMPAAVLESLADLFQHLSDPRRLRLLLMLADREHSVGDLAGRLGVTMSAVSHQLGTLRRARLVECRRDGQTCFYHLIDDHVRQLVRLGKEHVNEP